MKSTFGKICEAWMTMAFEIPLALVVFVVVWAFVWIVTMIALTIGIITGGLWAPPPICDGLSHILHAPRRLLTK